MQTNLLGFNTLITSTTAKPFEKGSLPFNGQLQLKNQPASDNFNGKTIAGSIESQTNSKFDDLLAFLGRKNKGYTRKQRKQQRHAKSKASHQKKKPKEQHKPRNTDYVRPVYEYKNMFSEKLVADINPDLKRVLANDSETHNLTKSLKRVSSLSTYLKEYMVGFITPDNEHWFEEALPFIYKGCVAQNINENRYPKVAKEFWGLMAKADNYWKSEEFLNYLNSMNKTPAVQATISAVESMIEPEYKMVAFTGYPSKIKYIPDLNKCAYSGRYLEWNTNQWHNPSAEHIFPHSLGGDDVNVDINYFVTSARSNSDRGNIPLLDFLRGWDAVEYYDK